MTPYQFGRHCQDRAQQDPEATVIVILPGTGRVKRRRFPGWPESPTGRVLGTVMNGIQVEFRCTEILAALDKSKDRALREIEEHDGSAVRTGSPDRHRPGDVGSFARLADAQ